MLSNFELITVKDPHFAYGFKNMIRKNYERDMDNKLEFINNYCKDNNIDTMLATGDICDKNTKKFSTKQYGTLKRKIRNNLNQINLISNVGNHDMENGLEIQEETEEYTTVFDELCDDNLLQNITRKPFINNLVYIQGVDFNSDREIVLENIKQFNEKDVNGLCKIIVLHSNVTPGDEKKTQFTYTQLMQDFEDIDIFVNGHYHIGYPTKVMPRMRGKIAYFINNWNLHRVMRDYDVSLNEHNVNMSHVKIGVPINNGGVIQHQISIKDVDIPHLSYEEAFEIKNIDLLVKTEDEIFDFFQKNNFDDLSTFRKTDSELIKQLFDTNPDYQENIINKVKNYLDI